MVASFLIPFNDVTAFRIYYIADQSSLVYFHGQTDNSEYARNRQTRQKPTKYINLHIGKGSIIKCTVTRDKVIPQAKLYNHGEK